MRGNSRHIRPFANNVDDVALSRATRRACRAGSARHRRAGLVVTAALLIGCADRPQPDQEGMVRSALTESRRISLSLPAGVDFQQTAVAAGTALTVADRAQINTPSGGFAASASAGSVASAFGVLARVGSITSVPAVTLSGARVTGSVVSGKAVTSSGGATVSGTITQNATLTPTQTLSWDIAFGVSTQPVTVAQSQTLNLAPGAYGNVVISPEGGSRSVPGRTSSSCSTSSRTRRWPSTLAPAPWSSTYAPTSSFAGR